MPLAYFDHDGSRRLGKIFGDYLVDLSVAAPELPSTVKAFLQAGPSTIERFDRARDQASTRFALRDVRLLAPVADAEKISWHRHELGRPRCGSGEAGSSCRRLPVWFNKQISCIMGPFDDVVKPHVSDKTDYEVELGVVIGRTCRHVSAPPTLSA